MARNAIAFLLLAALAAGCGGPPEVEFEAGPLTVLRLQRAAEAAGINFQRIEADIPVASHPGVEFNTRSWEDSLLAELRSRYDIAGLIDSADNEWHAQAILKHWLHEKIPGGTPEVDVDNAIEILDAAAEGHGFWCTQYAISYVQCALALGWQARKISLDHYHGPGGPGSRHHGAAEIWSSRWRKWVYMDPQSDLHFERDGVPLSSREVREAWLYERGQGVDHVVGFPADTLHENPAIVWWDLPTDETSLFFWLIWHDSFATWEADSPSPFYTPSDSFTAGKTWYQGGDSLYLHAGYRHDLFHPVEDLDRLHWTVGVVETTISGVERGRIILSLDTYMPDFRYFVASFDGGGWEVIEDPSRVEWDLGIGINGLSLQAVNHAGVAGPATTMVIN